MPDKVDILLERGFFGMLAFMGTTLLTFVGVHIKGDKDFRLAIHKKIDKNHITITDKLDTHKEQVSENYVSKDKFDMLYDMVKETNDYIKLQPPRL